jgi:hypothetical protein
MLFHAISCFIQISIFHTILRPLLVKNLLLKTTKLREFFLYVMNVATTEKSYNY